MKTLHVLYDERCGLCQWARQWAQAQPAYLDLRFLPAGSEQAAQLFPSLSNAGDAPPEDLIVVGDGREVYKGDAAWLMCLYALVEYREWSFRLSSSALRPLARKAFLLVSKNRAKVSRFLRLSDRELGSRLEVVVEEGCKIELPSSSLGGQPTDGPLRAPQGFGRRRFEI